MGFATACIGVTSLCLFTRLMPKSIAFANGLMESAIGVGYLIGPAVGGWLYEAGGGSRLPLLVNAWVIVAPIPLVTAVVRRVDDGGFGGSGGAAPRRINSGAGASPSEAGEDEEGGAGGDGEGEAAVAAEVEEARAGPGAASYSQIFSRPLFVGVLFLMFTLSVSFGVFPSTLPPHLQRTLHISEGGVAGTYTRPRVCST
jgi:MFS family permease